MLGVAELFSEGCGGADGETVGIRVGLHSEGLPGNIEKLDADPAGENTGANEVDSDTDDQVTEGEEVGSDTTSQDSNEDIKESREALIAGEQETGADAQPQEADVADVTQETSADAATSESSGEKRDVRHSRAVRSESPESAAEYESVDEQEADTNSSSTLVYILSTTMSILKAPLQPVFSTITQLPGQVIQVTETFIYLFKLEGVVYDSNPIHFLSNSENISSRFTSFPFRVCADKTVRCSYTVLAL